MTEFRFYVVAVWLAWHAMQIDHSVKIVGHNTLPLAFYLRKSEILVGHLLVACWFDQQKRPTTTG